jgi:hypothetical protein
VPDLFDHYCTRVTWKRGERVLGDFTERVNAGSTRPFLLQRC